ncbi:MAG: GNAT family N-acetyltransferase [Bacillota bacterium]
MELVKTRKPEELAAFLKRDYANNLYFFNYLDEIARPDSDATILVAEKNGAIALALLISPTHCCVSAADPILIDALAGRMPPVESTHILGRSDFTLKLLGVVSGPARKQKFYSFCRLNSERLPRPQTFRSVKASAADLPALMRLYAKSDILANYETRLPAILSSGTVYLVKEDGKVVSCALTTTETPEMAMIGAVFTDEPYRRRGFARDCALNLCHDLVERQKEVYLFYEKEDPLLARFYKEIGFAAAGEWVVATVNPAE